METIPHRELRNDSSRVLARVQAGERFVITNRGRPVAILAPPAPPSTELERLRESGRTRAAAQPKRRLADVPRAAAVSSGDLLDDLRGRW